MAAAPGAEVESSCTTFFPSRWRRALTVVAVVGLLISLVALGWLVWTAFGGPRTSDGWSTLLSIVVLGVSSARSLRMARRIGVTVGGEGVRLEGGWHLNPPGLWTWDEIQSVEVVEEEYIRRAPAQVLLCLRSDERVRLGGITGREAMVDQIRGRLSTNR